MFTINVNIYIRRKSVKTNLEKIMKKDLQNCL